MALTEKEREWLDERFIKINERLTEVRVDIATLQYSEKVRAGIWGIVGGLIPVLITVGTYVVVELIRRG